MEVEASYVSIIATQSSEHEEVAGSEELTTMRRQSGEEKMDGTHTAQMKTLRKSGLRTVWMRTNTGLLGGGVKIKGVTHQSQQILREQ